MIDVGRMKKVVLAAVTRVPAYKLVRNVSYRDYLAVQYLARTASERIPAYLAATGRLPTFRYSTASLALEALVRDGDPARIESAALEILGRNPERLEPYLALSDVATRRGNHETALQYARDGWLLYPESLPAASRAIRLGYLAGQCDRADREALIALRRFKLESGLLWLACKYCRTREQLDRIMEIARRPSDKPKKVSGMARPLAAAALRADCPDVALELYLEACAIELGGAGVSEPVATKNLEGKSGSTVIRELRATLESEGIPFFFAAGTALGLVRNGKPLDHDNDIDVGIFEQDWDRERLTRVFREHPNFDLDDVNPKSPKIGIRHRDGARIDLFKFYREGDGVFHDAVFVRWKNTPFSIERVTLDGGDVVYLPGKVDRYLTENYGDWRTPNSGFDAFVDGPNVEVTWPEYMTVHRVRRAYRFIRATDLVAARRELESVRASLMESPHGRVLVKEMLL